MLNLIKEIKQPILLTGATGFLGANLLHFFVKNNVQIHIIIREQSNLWRIKNIINKTHKHIVDLEDFNKIKRVIKKIKPKTIFHLATYGAYPYQNNFEKIKKINFDALINLIKECSKYDFNIFINTGSSSEYGRKNKKMSENDIVEPDNYYAIFKSATTLYCKTIAKKDKLPIITVRPFHVYGPYEEKTRLIPTIIKYLQKKQSPPLVSPNITRDMIYIEDVINFYILVAVTNNIGGEIFNIGSGKKYSIKEIFEKIKKIMKSNVTPIWGTIENRKYDKLIWYADTKKSRKKLKFHTKHSLYKGLYKTIMFFNKKKF